MTSSSFSVSCWVGTSLLGELVELVPHDGTLPDSLLASGKADQHVVADDCECGRPIESIEQDDGVGVG